MGYLRKEILKHFVAPFTSELVIFCVLWVMASLADVIGFFSIGEPLFGLYYALHGYIIIYIITFIASFLSEEPKRFIYLFFLLFGVVNVIIDVVCRYNFHYTFSEEVVEIIKATNASEAQEFLHTFIGGVPILLSCGVLFIASLFFIGLKFINRYVNSYSRLFSIMGLLLLVIAIASTTYKDSSNWNAIYINKIGLFFKKQVDYKLSEHRHDLQLEYELESIPNNIVIIIGESHSKFHSSLYGYHIQNSPRIAKRVNEENVFVYKNVASPAYHTLDAFKEILNSYAYDKEFLNRQEKWNESASIFDIAKALNMETFWISNQSRKGLWDNIPSSYAELCDSAFFTGEKNMVAGRILRHGYYDKDVVDLYKTIDFANKNKRKLIVFHLMGSHVEFTYRYPKEFEHFDLAAYEKKPQNQRQVLASYDNSILYNDYVVDEIIKNFENHDSMVIYFSDHSIDLYDSSESYYGHARPSDSVSVIAGKSIPFWVYLSPSCQQKRPELKGQITSELEVPFCTNMLYAKLLELLDIKQIASQ